MGGKIPRFMSIGKGAYYGFYLLSSIIIGKRERFLNMSVFLSESLNNTVWNLIF